MEPKSSITYQQCTDSELAESVKKIVHTNNINNKYLIFNNELVQKNLTNSLTSTMFNESNTYGAEQVNSEINLQDLCRVCANLNSHMIPIFGDEGLQYDLINKISKYLPINVTKNDTLPLQLCFNCASTLTAWHDLLEGSLNAEQKLLEIEQRLLLKTSVNKSDTTDSLKVQQNLEAVKESVPFIESTPVPQNLYEKKCTENSESSSEQRSSFIQTRSFTSRNIRRESVTSSKNFKEKLPTSIITQADQEADDFSEDDSCTNVIKARVNNEDSNNFSDETEQKLEENNDTSDKNSKSQVKHTRTRSYPCMYCDFVGNKKKLLQEHMIEIHPDVPMDDLIKKPSCVDKEMIENARMEADGRVYYHCEDCGKNLFSPYTFFWHKRIHTGERPFCCHLCGKQFRVNQGLARHLHETHEGIKNFSCDICDRTFATKRTLDDHRRIHTNERPYVCNRCGKTFKQKASLFVHNRTHSDVFPFKCIHCDQSFRTRPTLMVHITKHTGEKPHVCDICSRSFRIKYELKRHKLIHSDEKPWQCSECGLSFRQKRYLVNHKRTNHGS